MFAPAKHHPADFPKNSFLSFHFNGPRGKSSIIIPLKEHSNKITLTLVDWCIAQSSSENLLEVNGIKTKTSIQCAMRDCGTLGPCLLYKYQSPRD